MSLLTSVARGVAFGDVSNQAIRNILTEISKTLKGNFKSEDMEETLDYFGWKCPYTGRDLRPDILNKTGNYATDHIYPQNREWCGLNVKGNLIIVDKKANQAKRDQDVETFLLGDQKVLGGLSMNTRLKRLQDIKDFQKKCGYDPDEIRAVIRPIILTRYNELRTEQETQIKNALGMLALAGIHPTVPQTPPAKTASPAKGASASPSGKKASPVECTFLPADIDDFKDLFLKKGAAVVHITYTDGHTESRLWKRERLTASSDLKGNLRSKNWYRDNKDRMEKIVCEVI